MDDVKVEVVYIGCFGYSDRAVTNTSCSYKIPNSLPCGVPPLNVSFQVPATGRPSLSGLPSPAHPSSNDENTLLRIVSPIQRHHRLGRISTVHQLPRCPHLQGGHYDFRDVPNSRCSLLKLTSATFTPLLSSSLALETFDRLVASWRSPSLQPVFSECFGTPLSWPATVLKASRDVWTAECL